MGHEDAGNFFARVPTQEGPKRSILWREVLFHFKHQLAKMVRVRPLTMQLCALLNTCNLIVDAKDVFIVMLSSPDRELPRLRVWRLLAATIRTP